MRSIFKEESAGLMISKWAMSVSGVDRISP